MHKFVLALLLTTATFAGLPPETYKVTFVCTQSVESMALIDSAEDLMGCGWVVMYNHRAVYLPSGEYTIRVRNVWDDTLNFRHYTELDVTNMVEIEKDHLLESSRIVAMLPIFVTHFTVSGGATTVQVRIPTEYTQVQKTILRLQLVPSSKDQLNQNK